MDDFWNQRTTDEKRLLIDYYFKNIKVTPEPDLFSPLVDRIEPFCERLIYYLDLSDLYHLSITSKSIQSLIPLLDIAVKRKSFASLMKRLIQISQGRLTIKPRAVFDEKCRYVELGKGNYHICSICKMSGIILTSDHKCRGTIYDKHPEQYFDELFNLKYHKTLTKDQKAFIKGNLEPLFKQTTADLAKMSKYQKKRQFIELWDESEQRRSKLRKK